MSAWALGPQGSVDSLRLVERPDPAPAAGEALVRIRATALNYRDHMILKLIDSTPKPEHRIPLNDGAGEVVAVGAGVDTVKPGDRMMSSFFTSWLDGPLQPVLFGTDLGGGCDGTLAELAVFPASSLVTIPDSLSDEEAACLPCAALTAWVSLVEFGQMKAGDTVLLLGTGGVSIFGLQIARMMGAEAAANGINYARDPAWGRAFAEKTGGADLIIETGGAATLAQSNDAAAFNARFALIVMLGGVGIQNDSLAIIWKNIHLKGILVGSRRALEEMTKVVAQNGLRIDRRFSFDEALDAYRHLAAGAHFGKIVITHNDTAA